MLYVQHRMHDNVAYKIEYYSIHVILKTGECSRQVHSPERIRSQCHACLQNAQRDE